MTDTKTFATLLETFFTDRLMRQRCVSPHTIAAYRDTFRLLLSYAQKHLRKAPADITLDDLNADFIVAFLEQLEKQRKNSARSRNARLAAIRSFFRYIAYQVPERSALIERVLAIPSKRYDRALVDFLATEEVHALLATPDCSTWSGLRDHALLALAIQTGLRVSELIGLCWQDLSLGSGAHVRCLGKGRKARCTPLTKHTVKVMRAWMEARGCEPSQPVFPNARNGKLSRDGVTYILSKHVARAQQECPSLRTKRVSPHVLRHTTAMNLLHAKEDYSVIALWLGHERPDTAHIYVEADLAMKERILNKIADPRTSVPRYQPDDRLLAFLNNL